MGTIATDKRKITLYYNSATSLGKQVYAYVYALEKNVQTLDISKTKVTGTQWATIAEELNLSISDLVNKEHPDFTNNYETDSNLNSEDWIKILNAHPECLKSSVAIIGKEYFLIETPSDFINLMEPDSKALRPQEDN